MSSEYAGSAVEAWRAQVEKHHAQSEGVMEASLREGDFWRKLAPMFRADPYRTDDEILNVLLEMVSEDATVLDVGGGAGRFAIPIALRRGASATVVDPSPSMLEQLEGAASEVEGANVMGVNAEWESARVEAADLVLCSHVVYGVADIGPFVQKLHDHARGRVVMVSFVDSPQAGVAPLWEPVYGEERINLPALPELMNVLWGMGIYPSVRMMPPSGPQTFESVEAAVEEVSGRLFIGSDTGRLQRLSESIEGYLEAVDGGYRIREARAVRQGVVWWDIEG
ncbi:MAG: class I SAM-dependent methyltransferase [Dehalococcoidia bacterium]|nr:class I SAM-dependent methyltransferase [Dehalococcoidia bacterium]